MRFIIIAFILAIFIGAASALPLEGSSENASVVLFDFSRMPVADENSTQEILQVDVGLQGAKSARYSLMDQNGLVYPVGQIQPLSSGRQVAYFLTETDNLFKLINVTPEGSDPIYINWWMTPNASNDRLKVRYYGVWDSSINSTYQEVIVQVSVQNIGSESIYVTPFNFTLFDQWGWPYQPALGFDPEMVPAGSAASGRLLLGFTGLSPSVRPAALAYDFGASDQLLIVFDRDYVPLSDEQVYGAAAVSNTTTGAAASSVPAEPAAPASPALQPETEAAGEEQTESGNNATVRVSSIKQSVAESEARLAATREGLDKMTSESEDTAA